MKKLVDYLNEERSWRANGATLVENVKDIVSRFNITKVDGSTGFSEKDQKWYGWSHRAIFGFAIGDKLFEAGFGDEKTTFDKHGSETCKTLDDCHKAAKAFSDYVS